MGLIFNGLLKIPMQFAILFVGALVFVFYIFQAPPVFFNRVLLEETRQSAVSADLARVEADFSTAVAERRAAAARAACSTALGSSD